MRKLKAILPCLALAGCATPPARVAEPPVDVRVEHVAFTGEAGDPAAVPKSVAIEVWALRRPLAGASLDAATLAIRAEDGAPFRAVANLPPGCLWLDGDVLDSSSADGGSAVTDVQHLGAATALVLPAFQTRITMSLATLPGIEFGLRGDGCRTAILTPRSAEGTRDHVVLRDPHGAVPHVLFVPAANASIAGYAFVLRPVADAEPAEAAAATEAARAANTIPVPGTLAQIRRFADTSIGDINRRPVLLALAQRFALDRCVDALLAADEAFLVALTGALEAPAPAEAQPEWRFERAVWSTAVPLLQRDQLAAPMYGCVVRHFGALVRDPSSIERLLETSTDTAKFDEAVRDENVHALGSRDAVVRTRAHEWLTARGAAVPGFEPMAGIEARRDALRRHARRSEDR